MSDGLAHINENQIKSWFESNNFDLKSTIVDESTITGKVQILFGSFIGLHAVKVQNDNSSAIKKYIFIHMQLKNGKKQIPAMLKL